MFKRFKDRLSEVSEEVKKDPRSGVDDLPFILIITKIDYRSGLRESDLKKF